MGWGDAFGAIGGALKDVGDAVGDAIDEVADVAEDIASAGDWVANQACALDNDYVCRAGSVLGGLFSAGFSGLGGSLRGAGQFTEGLFGAAGNALQGRWKDALDDLGSATLGGFLSGWEAVTVFPRIADEAVRNWQRHQLRGFASDLIDAKYQNDQQRLAEARRIAGVDRRNPWGMRVLANYRCLEFSSFDVNLKALHNSPAIPFDLYQLAGYRPADGWPRETAPTAEVFALPSPDSSVAEGDFASRDQIDSYLSRENPLSRGQSGLLIRSVNTQNAERSMAYAEKIARDVGMLLSWQRFTHRVTEAELGNDQSFPFVWGDTEPLDERGVNRSAFLNGPQDAPADRKYRDKESSTTECHIEAFGVLRPAYTTGRAARGIALGLSFDTPGETCATEGRDDNCCITISTGATAGTVVSFMWPRNALARATNRFILAHEIGHWMGLCHYGHDELTQIMFTIDPQETAPEVEIGRRTVELERQFAQSLDGIADKVKTIMGWGTISRGLQHPRFTGADGRNIWRFTIDQRLDLCMGVSAVEPAPVE